MNEKLREMMRDHDFHVSLGILLDMMDDGYLDDAPLPDLEMKRIEYYLRAVRYNLDRIWIQHPKGSWDNNLPP